VLRSRHTVPLIVLALVVSALTAAGIVFVEWEPIRASEQADRYHTLLLFLVAASGLIFVIVTTFLVYSAFAFRAKKGDESDGPPDHGNTTLEVTWTVLPTILLAVMGVWASIVLIQNDEAEPDRERIEVTAQQFAWSFTWREGVTKPIESGDLRIPVGRQVELRMRSLDVIHSLYVPEFRLKQDVVPGLTTSLLIDATEPGTYPIICAELCGVGHGTMRARVIVMERPRYEAWLRQAQREVRAQEASAAAPPAPPAPPAGDAGP